MDNYVQNLFTTSPLRHKRNKRYTGEYQTADDLNERTAAIVVARFKDQDYLNLVLFYPALLANASNG